MAKKISVPKVNFSEIQVLGPDSRNDAGRLLGITQQGDLWFGFVQAESRTSRGRVTWSPLTEVFEVFE